MVISHLVWLLRTRDMRKIAKSAGQAFDENEECQAWQSKGIDLEKKMSTLFTKKSILCDHSESDDDSAETVVAPEHVVPKTVPNAMV